MEQSDLLCLVGETFNRLGIKYLVTGSQATIIYGEPRFTNDIDVVASLTRSNIDAFVSSFPVENFYVSAAAARAAIDQDGMFNVIHPASGLKIDVIISGSSPYEVGRFERARLVQVTPEFAATFAAPEDVILKKLEFYRIGGSDKHLRDIAGVLRISGDQLNLAFIEKLAAHFGLTEVWKKALDRAQ
jgi:hypothetical protein